MGKKESLLQIFPSNMRLYIDRCLVRYDELQEVRLRLDQPMIFIFNGQEYYPDCEGRLQDNIKKAWIVKKMDIEGILKTVCHDSLYAFEEEIRQGFLTVPGGHRIGMTGHVIVEQSGKIRNLKYINCLNIRVSHEIIGASDPLLPYVYHKGNFLNTVIIAPPGCGKTTLLRDLIRQISTGCKYGMGMTVGVVDERSEIGGCFMGKIQNQLGPRTDVLDGCPKSIGMMMLIRSMAPRVIAIDELGEKEEFDALRRSAVCGAKLLVTMHGDSIMDILKKMNGLHMLDDKMFSRYIVLEKNNGECSISKIYNEELMEC